MSRTIRKHKPLILNYFHPKKELSSGIVEGFNNKAKLTIRKSYGCCHKGITQSKLSLQNRICSNEFSKSKFAKNDCLKTLQQIHIYS
jgi:hypothetical protein